MASSIFSPNRFFVQSRSKSIQIIDGGGRIVTNRVSAPTNRGFARPKSGQAHESSSGWWQFGYFRSLLSLKIIENQRKSYKFMHVHVFFCGLFSASVSSAGHNTWLKTFPQKYCLSQRADEQVFSESHVPIMESSETMRPNRPQ